MTYGTNHLLIGGGRGGVIFGGGGGQEKILLFFLRGMGHYTKNKNIGGGGCFVNST